MKISGLIKTSLIDFPGKVAAVVFTQGCNFRCGFCHNPSLIFANKKGNFNNEDVLIYLRKRKNLLDGVVITGGEPTIQRGLLGFIKEIKDLGLLVKLDTNGSNPAMLEAAINLKLVDYIAMDIKANLMNYKKISGFDDTKKITKSINLIINSNIDYEFRTTVLPYYHNINEFLEIGKMINGAERYTIQGFRSKITLDNNLKNAPSFSQEDLLKISRLISPYVKKVVIHNNLN